MSVPTQQEIGEKIKKILMEDFRVAEVKIQNNATFRGDLALDSLDVVDLVFFVQKEFQIKARVEEYQDVKTVGRLVDHLHGKLVARAESGG